MTQYKLVPIEPTEEMIKAFNEPFYLHDQMYDNDVVTGYKSMLEASPTTNRKDE
jgi:hypothetical protein